MVRPTLHRSTSTLLSIHTGVPATVQKFPLTRLLNAQLSSHPSYSSHEFTLSVLPPNKHQVLTIRGAVKAENVKGATEWCKIVMENAYKGWSPYCWLRSKVW